MPRLKIDLPERRLTSFTIPVRITDVNYGNHVGNNAMIEISTKRGSDSCRNMALQNSMQAVLPLL